jgi:hypothetical protein
MIRFHGTGCKGHCLLRTDYPWRWAEKEHIEADKLLGYLEDAPNAALIHFLDSNVLPADIALAVEKELAFRLEELVLWAARQGRRAGDEKA